MWICSLQAEFYTEGPDSLSIPPPSPVPHTGAFSMGVSLKKLLIKS